MSIPNRLLALVVVAVALAASASRTAVAKAKPEAAADRAMNELFSSAQFEEAKASLEKTIAECDRCSKHTLAVLHADLAGRDSLLAAFVALVLTPWRGLALRVGSAVDSEGARERPVA